MDPRTRFVRSIRGGAIDRFFRYEHGMWPSTRDRWLKEGLPASVGCYPDSPGFTEHFGFDPVIRIGVRSGYTDSPYWPGFEKEIVESAAGHVTYRDTDGIVKKVLTAHSDTSMPQFLRFPVRTREDWEEVRLRLDPADAAGRIGDTSSLEAACADAAVPTLLPLCGAFGHPRNLLGDEGLAYALYDSPDLIDAILSNWYELYARLIAELSGRIRIDAILIWEDMCYKTGPLIDPGHFRQFMLPHYLRLISMARTCGVECVIVDSDGDVTQMIPLFIEAGVDCLMPFEVQAGMDVVAIRKRFGDAFCIMGGIDKRALTGGRVAIRTEVNRVVPSFIGSGHFIPTLDHTVPPNVPLEGFTTYLECVRAFEAN
jgi:uroporphyrinogen-III decarboxylase